MGASHDHKAKDQAALEMNFAESKIKALQAELAKINSSLHAYQAERLVHACSKSVRELYIPSI